MHSLSMTISPEPSGTRMLLLSGHNELMRAVLGPAAASHPRAAATLLEGLSLWHQTALSVVLSVDARDSSSAVTLCDGLGFGQRTVHYDVDVVLRPDARRRECRLGGLGDFRELRRLCLEGGSR